METKLKKYFPMIQTKEEVMGKMRSFLRFFVYVVVAFFANVAVANGAYNCPTVQKYISCV